ncbi:MAG: N-acetylglutaminylglutamine amidotransferase [Rhodospirillales bacterium]
MCGLCGEVRFDSEWASTEAVRKMTASQARRGPDAAGLFAQGRIAFGHRRLKVIDRSEHAQQPMVDSQLGLAIVYNGAIYNYPDLRRALEAKGYTFFSNGDTEVILKAFHAWGDRCVERFNGMFAFAIWERDGGRVTFARDRLGIKPLYYVRKNSHLRFASTLPALLAAGDVSGDIDPVALHHYMSFHAVVPPPYTIMKDVRKLPPATVMTVEPDGTTKERTYWRLQFGSQDGDAARGEDEWQEMVLDSLRAAVKRRLVADVPVGALLSGGLDSSLIVGLLHEAGSAGLETFSVGFERVDDEPGDEFKYSDIIVERFGTKHHKIMVESERLLNALPDCIGAMSEPMMSHDAIGFYLLSQEVSKHLTMVQSGQGADEVFGGYHWYPPLIGSNDAASDYKKVFFDRDHDEFAQAVEPAYVDGNHSSAFVERHFAQPGAERPVDKALRIDTTVMLVDDPVKRVDNMTMAWGLEARVPFLDHEVVELAARVPAELKIREGGKWVLKEAARRVVPGAVIDRPKGYFPVPALKYLEGPALEFVCDVLNQPAAQNRGVFRRDYLNNLLKAPKDHITPLMGSKLWQIALLESWFQEHHV